MAFIVWPFLDRYYLFELKFTGVCQSLSHVRLFVTPWTVARQVSLSMEFSRKEYSTELTFLMLGDLANPGIKPMSFVSPALAGRFITSIFL